MAILEQLAALDVRQAITRFRDALRDHQDELNRLNVYPVPDGDTGTNMTLTLESVVNELGTAEDMAEVCQAVAHGSLMGARGNSGVILSQILRGLADTFRAADVAGPAEIAVGLRKASDAAYEAVMRPVEGTILTVVREAAEAAEAARDAGEQTLVGVLDAALTAAREAVLNTPELLPVLKEAGVIDAGGRGFTLLLDAFLEVVADRPIPEPEIVNTPSSVAAHLSGSDLASLRYEVMYLLEAEDSTIPAFKQTWAALGDSIVVVGGEGLWNCHVHTDDIGGAIEAGIEAGRPRHLRITDLLEQVEEEQWVREQDAGLADMAGAVEGAPVSAGPEVETAVVAVGVGVGINRLLVSLGVQEVVAGGQSMNPSTAQILEAVERCPAQSVVVLPNNKNIVPVARQVDGLTSRDVHVVPTTSVVEALAALVAYDPHTKLDDNAKSMNDAIERVAAGEVTQAVRDSVAECGPIAAGDWLAISRDGIRDVASTPVDAALAVVASLLTEDSEIVTVLVGAEARNADTERVRQLVSLAHPHVEVEVHEGGQPLYPYLIGVE
jgi:DAK2 domain fusion protein YloV